MDAERGQVRMADYLRDNHDKVVGRWTEDAAALAWACPMPAVSPGCQMAS